MTDDTTQLAVIGGGPGGYAAAFMAADLGLTVTLIDPAKNPGGVCLYHGCIPSKALLHVSRVIAEAGEAEAWGVSFGKPKVNIDRLRDRKNEVVSGLTEGLGRLVQQRRITYLQGTAAFLDNRTLAVSGAGGGDDRRLVFEHAVIATGAVPVRLAQLDTGDDRILDSTRALEMAKVPKKLLVVGGGYIGLELGTVFAALGSKVTVAEMTAQLLPGVDRDLVTLLEKRLSHRLEAIFKNTTVLGLKAQKNGLRAVLRTEQNGEQVRLYDQVLVAVGRRPETAGLGLENTGIACDERGFIRVDRQRRTAEAHIFAIGDVAGEPMLAHKAAHEGRVAAEVIAGREALYEPLAVPAVVFTDPEIAWAGTTEAQAREQGLEVALARFPWAASGRAATLGRSDGLTKLVVDPGSERVLGVGIAGPGAGELIAEAVLAIEMNASVADLGLSIHPHPTLSETLKESADVYHGTATHFRRAQGLRRS
jgi:dihydrolipoamide dehydrogenase